MAASRRPPPRRQPLCSPTHPRRHAPLPSHHLQGALRRSGCHQPPPQGASRAALAWAASRSRRPWQWTGARGQLPSSRSGCRPGHESSRRARRRSRPPTADPGTRTRLAPRQPPPPGLRCCARRVCLPFPTAAGQLWPERLSGPISRTRKNWSSRRAQRGSRPLAATRGTQTRLARRRPPRPGL